MKTLLILGAGTAGTMIARKMVNKLDSRDWKVIVVDKDQQHYYQPGFLFIPFGIYKPEAVVRPKKNYLPRNVEFVLADVEQIQPQENRVTLAGGRVINYDFLVIATGTDIAPEQTEGLLGGGWRQNIFDFYTYDGAVALSKALKNFNGGRLVMHISEMPIKCPVAPLEFIFLADWYLKQRGIRNKTELVYATPLPGAFTKPVAAAALGDMLTKKGIHVEPEFNIMEVDSGANLIRSYDEREIPYDLLVTVPVNMGAKMIQRSGLGDDLNYVPTNKHTLQSDRFENIFAMGDAANIPASKAGSVIHFQMETVVENLLAAIQGKPLHAEFDGHAICFVETGFSKAFLIDFSYDVQPLPGKYPVPGVGPMTLLRESGLNHLGKLGFYYMYWDLMMKGIDVPLPSKFSIAGKDRSLA
ncbi:uncharacterized NAD(FAD)-dependent dehydrogenase [Longilinea arvoryzae]|uniref:Uncharacterized NAD(FAD)-dependent dehydrogenase n=1 Tax=Longilinea arvoryzae TaxID=360412 RepID=A0A0S7BH02_9CHLR|nr:FAD/NAD(P)-binding oxidoreductase [Longilinea arvoryzae]GAP13330.1 uncharacterized NAD(FAD)-dependent dehydrogenase [Longilinea arvoryzae]